MPELYRDANEIKETDIVFDCPNCGKSLAIDYRGAGLTIPCTDCGQYVDVPIPEGMEVTDIDSSDEEQEIRILNLRRSLGAAETRIAEMEVRIRDMEAKQSSLTQDAGSAIGSLADVQKAFDDIRRLVGEVNAVLARIAALTQSAAEAQSGPSSAT
jgi:transcription elongation factor Elf1